MHQSNFFFKQLFESTPHPYLILQADEFYTIIAVNDYYLNATGIIRENVIGKPLFEVFPDNPKDESVSGVSDLHISLDSVVRYGKTDIMGVQKYDIPLRDGTDRFEVKYWSPVNAPIFGEDGKVRFIIHNVEDVTDFILFKESKQDATQSDENQKIRLEAEVLKRANEVKEANRIIKAREKELAVLNDKLKELDRLKTEFFSNISHEFRTPLTLMLAPIEELLSNRHNISDERVASNLEIAHRNLLRLLKLVNTLLDFSRIEAGRVRASYEATDLSALTAELASNFSSASELAAVKLIVDCPPMGESVEVDHDMWEKIVLNLLSNAFKFTHHGSITVSTRAEKGNAVLRVQDTGIGIPSEALPKLFDRFYRVENAQGRTYEGTGIGLSLVQELVKLQGGRIDVTSTEGEGTTFSVYIPLGVKHTSSEPKRVTTKHDEKEPHDLKAHLAEVSQWSTPKQKEVLTHPIAQAKGHILVADDNPDMREFIKRLLEDAGYSVSLAVDGEDAWEMCQKNLPDLVLSDVMMPRLNGFEFLKKIRSAEYTYSLPIILISARAGEADKAEGLTSGADDYLSKPFHSGELIARVDGAVKLGKYRKQAHEQLLNSTNRIAKIGGWSFDVETMKGDWTEELIRIHDLPSETPIDVNEGLDFYTPQSRPIIEKAVQEAIAQGKPYDLQLEIISAVGVHKWVRTVGEPVIQNGKVIKVQGVMQDITELKRSEIESQRNLMKYQNLFESSQEALMTFSPVDGKFTRANQATLQLFGVDSEAEFLAMGPATVSPPFQPDGRRSDEKAQEMMAITLRDGSNFFEWRHHRRSGEIFDADVLLTRMKNGGTTPFIQAAVRDITERKQSEERLHTTLLGIIGTISGIVEMRDPYTAGHEKRVALLACAIAKELGISEDQIEGLQLAAEIHDLGKIQIPAEILVKPTRLSELEFKMIQTHPEAGYELLKDIEFPWPIAQMIRQHHEKLDGSGYPLGIKGDEILLEAQILSVADIVESMASHRPYRAALGVDAALEEIRKERGTKLNPQVVDACITLFKENRFSF
ncbi:HD domain-containing phosphohydrolase [Sulfuricurvum sp.]|uniref:HD domain-containing phosphohydrolase n=1 Tax=Sulfuricurvum sp. TaxID=2025608 RepID=UPI00260BD3D2|nr:HD domain-containing phosphohydrolase [Sulfuricurvum sp.]MDD2781821.1 response regulator [Sulfuricurvum sp.]